MKYDAVVVGGGIVGLSTARKLQEGRPGIKVAVLEKEDHVAAHQTGHNSGVIHSGIYYPPGSLKATNCTQGRQELVSFCERYGVDYEMCGKVIVAVTDDELPGLKVLLERGIANGVRCEWMERDALREREPHVEGKAAVMVHDAGIADYPGVASKLAELIRSDGGEVFTSRPLTGVTMDNGAVVMQTPMGELSASIAVNCAGIQSDRIARMAGVDPGLTMAPFRGLYYDLTPDARRFCNHLIYPVPNPEYPFLGVHLTRMIDGRVEVGPNAVLASGREAYSYKTVNWSDLKELFAYRGFRRLMSQHWGMGLHELLQTLSKRRYLRAVQRLVPGMSLGDLTPGKSGIRAQAVFPDGSMAQDFVIKNSARFVHVLNAPSPAATSGLKIGSTIADRVLGE